MQKPRASSGWSKNIKCTVCSRRLCRPGVTLSKDVRGRWSIHTERDEQETVEG